MLILTKDITLYSKEIYNKILIYLEKFDFITNQQCANIFYSNSKYALQEANRTLNKLVKAKLIKVKKTQGMKNIYYTQKPITRIHPILLMDLYSMFIKNGFEINYFAKEVNFGIKVPDGVLEYTNPQNEKIVPLLIEIDCFNKTKVKKLEELYDSNVVQKYYLKRYKAPIFPNVVILSNTQRNDYSDKVNIIHMTHDLKDFTKYFHI